MEFSVYFDQEGLMAVLINMDQDYLMKSFGAILRNNVYLFRGLVLTVNNRNYRERMKLQYQYLQLSLLKSIEPLIAEYQHNDTTWVYKFWCSQLEAEIRNSYSQNQNIIPVNQLIQPHQFAGYLPTTTMSRSPTFQQQPQRTSLQYPVGPLSGGQNTGGQNPGGQYSDGRQIEQTNAPQTIVQQTIVQQLGCQCRDCQNKANQQSAGQSNDSQYMNGQ